MSFFWKGFHSKEAGRVPTKRHVIVLYWSGENKNVCAIMDKVRLRHPTIMVKTVNVERVGIKSIPKNITEFPTVLLLKNGKELDRYSGTPSHSVIDQFFRRAST